jgi:type IV secretion system protein VirB10
MSRAEDDSPNGLGPMMPPSAEKSDKRLGYAAAALVCCMIVVLVYSVQSGQDDKAVETKKAAITQDEKALLRHDGPQQGIALKAPDRAMAARKEEPEEKKNEPIVVVRDVNSRYSDELAALRRQKQQAEINALSSPLMVRAVKRSEATGTREPGQSLPSGGAADARPAPASAFDAEAAADRDKEAFYNRATRDSRWIAPYARTAGQPLELKTGTVIPGVMVTGINSDLPGSLIGQVSQNVYDSRDGRQLLIPQGSKLYGVYDSRVVYGQERVLIAWNRVIFPDGSSMTLGAMPGADMSGYAGFEDQVNNHYLRLFGSAVLMSLITGGSAYAMDSTNNSGDSDSDKTSMQDEMISALSAQLGQTGAALLQKNLTIKPTLEIRPGYQFIVVLTQDLVFKEPYTAWR